VSGREFVQSPGPTNIPHDVLAAASRPATDFYSADFRALVDRCHAGLQRVFKTSGPILFLTSSGHGGWESAIVNLVPPGRRALVPVAGRFGEAWAGMAEDLGVRTERLELDWRRAVDPAVVADRLAADHDHEIAAVLLVHTDTATGITSDLAAIRAAVDATGHPALFVVDAVASLAISPVPMDELRLDAVLAASQKGLMMPPGMAFIAVSRRAVEAAMAGGQPSSYWSWRQRLGGDGYVRFGGTPPEQHLFALDVALQRIEGEGLDAVIARHRRLASAVRRAVEVWSEEGAIGFQAVVPEERSDAVTCIRTAEGIDADRIRSMAGERFSVTLGAGLGPLAGRAFRIGHLGDLNEPMILGALGGVEAALLACDVPIGRGGVSAAAELLAST
jgi:alanine-glyoxylate transaminase/serine-glyoxylate transaminase/serine-pyruvate transaminase